MKSVSCVEAALASQRHGQNLRAVSHSSQSPGRTFLKNAHPSSFPSDTHGLFSASARLVLFCLSISFGFQIPPVREIMRISFFSVWLLWLSTRPSGSIHVVANGKIPFVFIAGWCSLARGDHALFVHSSMGGRSQRFRLVAVAAKAAASIGVCTIFSNSCLRFLWTLSSGVTGSHSSCVLNFVRTLRTVFYRLLCALIPEDVPSLP